MKKLVMVLVAGLLVTALAVPALAWEYSMSGDWEYKYAYIARTGQNDLYGNAFHAQANPNLGTTIGLSGPFGGAVVPEAYSAMGSDGSYTVQRFRIYPQIRLNPALRWRGELTMAGSNQRHYWDWTDADGASVRGLRSMAIPQLRRSWVTAQLPWGILAVGRRPGNWGTGWATLHPKDIHSDSVAIVAPYGPLTLILTHYLHDSGQDAVPGANQNATDNNLVRKWNFAYAIAYNAGDLSLGTLSRYVGYEDQRGQAFPGALGVPARRIVDGNTTSLASIFIGQNAGNVDGWPGPAPITGDVGFLMQVSYLKYNNGRFFANGEYTFQYADANRNGARPLSGWTQAWHAELGTVVGPAKVTLAHFYSSGHDRRGGAFGIGAQGKDPFYFLGSNYTYDTWTHFISFGNRQHAIKPFQYLIGLYGGGNNSYDGEGYCTFDDFLAYALRLDYALAANLNVYGSFMWAERASNTATPIAFYSGGLAGGTALGNRLVPYTGIGGIPAVVPNVPESNLGWEIDAGVDWKLLEGLTFRSLFAYWQPGDWFKWAYADQSPNPLTGAAWTTPIAGGTNPNYQINIDRTIDPIIGFKGSMVMEF